MLLPPPAAATCAPLPQCIAVSAGITTTATLTLSYSHDDIANTCSVSWSGTVDGRAPNPLFAPTGSYDWSIGDSINGGSGQIGEAGPVSHTDGSASAISLNEGESITATAVITNQAVKNGLDSSTAEATYACPADP